MFFRAFQISINRLRFGWALRAGALLALPLALSAQTATKRCRPAETPPVTERQGIRCAASAFDSLKDPAAVPLMAEAMRHSDPKSPAAGVLLRTLGKFQQPEAVAAVAGLLPGSLGPAAADELLKMGPSGIQAGRFAHRAELRRRDPVPRGSWRLEPVRPSTQMAGLRPAIKMFSGLAPALS